MNWTDEPATEQQLSHLGQLGWERGRPLTKGEASHLIQEFEAHPEARPRSTEADLGKVGEEAHRLHVAVEEARRTTRGRTPEQVCGQEDLDHAVRCRQEFWADTCREAQRMHSASPPVIDLYRRHGCRFATPSGQQIQDILDALDSAAPHWDREHPELFYQTLELNYRELLRRR